jgi:drug/metabolite transporter (DMT)-like permease
MQQGEGASRASGAAGVRAETLGVALAVLASVLWSSSGLLVKILPVAPVPLAGLRALLACLALAPFWRPHGLKLAGLLTPSLAVLLTGYMFSVLCYVSAVRLTTASNAIALVATAPAWVVALTWLAERRMRWELAWPVGLVLIGVAVILAEPAVGTSLEGNLLGLGGGLAFGLFTFFLPRVRLPAVGRVVLCNLVAAVVLFLAMPQAFFAVRLDAWGWLALAYLGAIQIGLATVCFAAALARIGPARASVLGLVEPLLAPVWVFLAIGEMPSPYGLAGGVFILGGIAVNLFARPRRAAPA